MAFESPLEKLLLVGFVVLSLVAVEVSTGFFSQLVQQPIQREKISASNYPNHVVKKEISSEKLVLTYNPELAIVSPDRTPFIDLVLKIKNERDVPRTLKLVFPDPATLLTDDPRFVVAHTNVDDENSDRTYQRLVLFLPENAEREVKIRYENAYAALDGSEHDVVLELYNEDEQKVADITYMLRSVVLGFEGVWTLPTMPTDTADTVGMWTGAPSFDMNGEFIYWIGGSDVSNYKCRGYSAEIPLGKYSGSIRFSAHMWRNSNARVSFHVKVKEGETWRTLFSCYWDNSGNNGCPSSWNEYEFAVGSAEMIQFSASLCGESYSVAGVRVKDLMLDRTRSWQDAYHKTVEKPVSGGQQTVEETVDVPDGRYRGFLVRLWDDFGSDYCAWDYIKIDVYDGSGWTTKATVDPGDFCGYYRGAARQPVWIDTSDLDTVTQLKIVWRVDPPGGTRHLYAKVYMAPYEFPNSMFFEEVCDENTTHTLQLQTDGEFGILQFPQNRCTTLKKQAVNTVHVRATYEGQSTELNLPVFYDPDRSDDLLWEMYTQWKEGLEVNGQ